jgi:hypothetical protein
MKKSELQAKLSDIHTLLTRALSAQTTDDRFESEQFLIKAEHKLNELEIQVAEEPDSN